MRVLLSFVGNRDPFVDSTGETGPVLSLLEVERFDAAVLFCTGSDNIERARSVQQELGAEGPTVHLVVLNIESPVDYTEIYTLLKSSLAEVQQTFAHRNARYSVLLDPGTPPRFAGGAYKVRRIDLSEGPFAGISIKTLESSGRGSDGPSILFQSDDFLDSDDDPLAGEVPSWIVGNSDAFWSALERALQVARYRDLSILIRGETGSGVIAKLIHGKSDRQGPLITVNCAATSTNGSIK